MSFDRPGQEVPGTEVPDVLGAVEDPEGEASQEVPGTEVPRNWSHLETSFGLQIPLTSYKI